MVHRYMYGIITSLFIVSALSANKTSQAIILRESAVVDMRNDTLQFAPDLVRLERLKKPVSLLYDKDGFYVRTKNKDIRIHAHDTAPLLRNKTHTEILKYAALGKFKISQFNNKEYSISMAGSLNGGGAAGAAIGAHVGMVATNIIGHGILWGIAALTAGPAAPAVYAGLAAVYAPGILAASKGVAIGVGIAAGVATGPV